MNPLKELRLAAKLTQMELSRQSKANDPTGRGVTQAAISMQEQHGGAIGWNRMQYLCEPLGLGKEEVGLLLLERQEKSTGR